MHYLYPNIQMNRRERKDSLCLLVWLRFSNISWGLNSSRLVALKFTKCLSRSMYLSDKCHLDGPYLSFFLLSSY